MFFTLPTMEMRKSRGQLAFLPGGLLLPYLPIRAKRVHGAYYQYRSGHGPLRGGKALPAWVRTGLRGGGHQLIGVVVAVRQLVEKALSIHPKKRFSLTLSQNETEIFYSFRGTSGKS